MIPRIDHIWQSGHHLLDLVKVFIPLQGDSDYNIILHTRQAIASNPAKVSLQWAHIHQHS